MRSQNNKIIINSQKQEVHNCKRAPGDGGGGGGGGGLQFQSRNNIQHHQRLFPAPLEADLTAAEDSYSNLSSNSLSNGSHHNHQPSYMMKRASRESKHYRPEVEQEFQAPIQRGAPLLNFGPSFNGQRVPMKLSARQLQQLEAEQLAQKAATESSKQQNLQEHLLNNNNNQATPNNLDQHQRYLRNQVHQQLQRVYGQPTTTNEQDNNRMALSNLHRTNQKPLDEIQHEFMMKQQYQLQQQQQQQQQQQLQQQQQQQQQQLKERLNEQLHYRKQQQLEAAEVAKQQHHQMNGADLDEQFLHEQYRLMSMNQRRRKESSVCSKTMNQEDLIYEQLASESLLNGGCQEDLYSSALNRRPIKLTNHHHHHQGPIEMIREETSSEYQLQSECMDGKALPPAVYGLTGASARVGQQQQQPQQVYERPTVKSQQQQQQLSHRQQTYLNLPQLLVAPPPATTRQLQPVALPIALSSDDSVYERSLIPSNGFLYGAQQANSSIALRAELISRLLFGSGIFNQLKGRFFEPYYSIPVAPMGPQSHRPTINAVFAAPPKPPQAATCGPLYGVIDKKQLAPVSGGRPLSIIATTMGGDGGGGTSITELKAKPPNVSITVNDMMDRKKKSASTFNLKHLWILIFLLAIGTTFIAIFFNFK